MQSFDLSCLALTDFASADMLKKYKRKAKEQSRKEAAEMGLTPMEYGLLKVAYLEAEITAKRNETLDQTRARAKEIWHEELKKHREQQKKVMNSIMSLPEKYRKKVIAKMRTTYDYD